MFVYVDTIFHYEFIRWTNDANDYEYISVMILSLVENLTRVDRIR